MVVIATKWVGAGVAGARQGGGMQLTVHVFLKFLTLKRLKHVLNFLNVLNVLNVLKSAKCFLLPPCRKITAHHGPTFFRGVQKSFQLYMYIAVRTARFLEYFHG